MWEEGILAIAESSLVSFFSVGVLSAAIFILGLIASEFRFSSEDIKAMKPKIEDEYGTNVRRVQHIISSLILSIIGIFVYNMWKVFSTYDQSEKQISLITCCVAMTLFFGFAGILLALRSVDPEEKDKLMLVSGLEKAHTIAASASESRSLDCGLWGSKNGHYFREVGDIVDISREAIASRISNPDYNFVTRKKTGTLEYSREAMFTDILLLSARDELGVVSGGKNWTLAHHEADGNITVETIVVVGTKWNCYRVSGMIHATPMEVASLVIDDNRIGEYDEMFDRIEFLERIDERSAIRHSYYKPIWPTTARDFVIITTWEPLDDGRVLVATRSVQHPLVGSQIEGYVRARVLIAGYVMTPVQGEDGNLITFCDVIIHTDVSCDWLPPAFINPFSNTKPVGYFKNMQRICSEEFPPTPLQIDS